MEEELTGVVRSDLKEEEEELAACSPRGLKHTHSGARREGAVVLVTRG